MFYGVDDRILQKQNSMVDWSNYQCKILCCQTCIVLDPPFAVLLGTKKHEWVGLKPLVERTMLLIVEAWVRQKVHCGTPMHARSILHHKHLSRLEPTMFPFRTHSNSLHLLHTILHQTLFPFLPEFLIPSWPNLTHSSPSSLSLSTKPTLFMQNVSSLIKINFWFRLMQKVWDWCNVIMDPCNFSSKHFFIAISYFHCETLPLTPLAYLFNTEWEKEK